MHKNLSSKHGTFLATKYKEGFMCSKAMTILLSDTAALIILNHSPISSS